MFTLFVSSFYVLHFIFVHLMYVALRYAFSFVWNVSQGFKILQKHGDVCLHNNILLTVAENYLTYVCARHREALAHSKRFPRIIIYFFHINIKKLMSTFPSESILIR